MKKVSVILLLFESTLVGAQLVNSNTIYPAVTIPGSETRTIYSPIVNQEYELQILLPGGYRNSNKKYPVVYLMDSQWDFPLVKSIYGQQYYDGFIPELIIVGVTWGGVKPNPDSLRARDYTPTKENRIIQSGGADRFLLFMKDELFPFVENNYKADSLNRTLMGCSLGGLITLYALFTHTELFTGYIAASPAIGWGSEIVYQYEKSFYESQLYLKKRFSQRLYMTIGGVERGVPGFEKLAALLSSRNYNSQKVFIQSKVLENTGHSGTKSETFSRGLQWVFERPKLILSDSVQKMLYGSYRRQDDKEVQFKQENGSLFLVMDGNKYPLFASDNTHFYSTTEFLNISFQFNESGAIGFQLDRYGNSQFIRKIK